VLVVTGSDVLLAGISHIRDVPRFENIYEPLTPIPEYPAVIPTKDFVILSILFKRMPE
jgi:hypothetical protein